jgi:ribosomal protein L22
MTPSKPGDSEKGKPAEAEKAEVEATEASETAAVEAAQEQAEAPKPRRSRRKKADEEAAATEPVAEEDADEIEPTEEDIEAADEAASEEELDEDEVTEDEPAPAARRRRGRRSAEPADEAPAAVPRRTRERAGGDGIGERVLVRAQAKYVRTSARKARLVCDHIRGKSVQEARAILALTPRAVARDWSKLLESAVANAEHNHELLGDDLRIAQVTADEGPTLKRFRPRAMGRATRIRKRTSHLTILLTPKES